MGTVSTQKISPAPLTSALREAQTIIESAEKRSAELLSSAERAYEEAKHRGYAEGFAQAEQEVANNAIRLIEDQGSLGEKLSQEAAKLAVALAEQILGEQINIKTETVVRIAARALQQTVVGDTLTITVHPHDHEHINKALPNLKRIAGTSQVSVDTDPELQRGGCIIRTEFGEIDASIERLLSGLANRLGIDTK